MLCVDQSVQYVPEGVAGKVYDDADDPLKYENLDTRIMGRIKILRFASKIHTHLFALIPS